MPKLAELQACTGCGACVDACAAKAIAFVEDADGFVRPQVDAARCKSCGSCTRACPALQADHAVPVANGTRESDFFAARLRDATLLGEVSSGGVFWALARATIARGGVVYGAVQTEVGHVRHVRAETLEEAKALRRSKYLPSDVRGCYAAVRQDLLAGREVLFSGTGCQVAALNAFLGKTYPTLLTCDVVCHGIPSMLAWRSYRSEKEAAVGKKMVDLVFRDKSLGWKKNQYCITYADGSQERERITTQLFHAGYLRGLFYRPSCGICPFATLPRVADLTLADFWKYEGPLFSERGVSLVVVNSARGREVLDAAAAYLETEQVSRDLALTSCRHLDEHPAENPQRTAFLAELRRNGYHAAARKFITFPKAGRKASLPVRVIREIGALLRGQRDPDGTRALVRTYAADLGVTPIFPGTPGGLLRLLLGSPKNALVISGNKRVLELAKRRGFERSSRKKICAAAARNLALRDAFLLLARKGVSVYFVNRVGKLKTPEWRYAESAARRMEQGLSFPTMYENPSAHEADLRELFGEKYSPEYVREVGRIPQIVQTGGVCRHEDFQSRLVNVVGGLRVTCGQPKTWARTVHVYGRCGAFGYAVEDADTLPSQLQHELNARGCTDVRVVNHGLWGGSDDCLDANFLHEAAGFRAGDVVLFYRKHLDPRLMKAWTACGVRYLDITAAWHEDPAAKSCFYDRPGHMNAVGYGLVARLVAADLLATEFAGCPVAAARLENLTTPWLTRYLKQQDTTGFDAELDRYVEGVRALCPPLPPGQTAGAIVMNCNPFTNGHRKLIEQAAREVDRLYILVVEEDRSVFPFAARFEMVKAGTADLGNVVVAPSGRFVISSLTFPEYFMKDYVKEKDFDVSGDVRTFCERIAPPLGITVRFAGAEPFDPVTANYNRSMAELLPQYGLRFREIPRFATADGCTISATEVRRLLIVGDFDGLASYVPDSTLRVLKANHRPKGAAS